MYNLESDNEIEEIKKLNMILAKNLRNKNSGPNYLRETKVGTKIMYSYTCGIGSKIIPLYSKRRYKIIANDIVAANLNNLCTKNAKVVSFADYIVVNKLDTKIISEIIINIDRELIKYDCELLGGQTSEIPDLIRENQMGISATVIGVGDKESNVNFSNKDVVIGFKSNGIHVNNFNLIQKLYNEHKLSEAEFEETLKPSYNYYNVVSRLWQSDLIKAAANISRGGIWDNLTKVITENRSFNIDYSKIPEQHIYMKLKNIIGNEIYQIFNCGVGFCVIADRQNVDIISDISREFNPFILGEVI